MCARMGCPGRLGIIAVVLSLGSFGSAAVFVVNYDNHPALAKAKEYDLMIDVKQLRKPDGSFNKELYDSYAAKASRELAEKYYLQYLEDVNESFQRAAVYARLGEMFNGIVRPEVATTVDRTKARLYYRKALEAEPNRIGWPTLQARGFFATDAESPKKRFQSYMDYYQWLLSIDEKKLRENALPTRLPRKAPPPVEDDEMVKRIREAFEAGRRPAPDEGRGMLHFIKTHTESTARNLVHEAAGRMAIDPKTRMWSRELAAKSLLVLTERFPNTSVARRARAKLAETFADITDDMLLFFENELDERWTLGFIPAVQYAVARGEPFFFDLKEGKLIDTPGILHSEETYMHLLDHGGDYLAWDGALITLPGNRLFAVHAASQGQMGENKRRWSVSYGIPEKVVLPYDVWMITKDGRKYLVRLAAARPEGMHLLYRRVSDQEFESGGETRASGVGNEDGSSNPASYRPD